MKEVDIKIFKKEKQKLKEEQKKYCHSEESRKNYQFSD